MLSKLALTVPAVALFVCLFWGFFDQFYMTAVPRMDNHKCTDTRRYNEPQNGGLACFCTSREPYAEEAALAL